MEKVKLTLGDLQITSFVTKVRQDKIQGGGLKAVDGNEVYGHGGFGSEDELGTSYTGPCCVSRGGTC